MRVVEVNSIEGLPGLRLVWRSLLKETPGATYQQSCEWLEAAFPRLPPSSHMRVMLVSGGGETVGILPLVQTDRATRCGVLRVLGYPYLNWTYLDLPCLDGPFNDWPHLDRATAHGPIGPQPTATLMAVMRYLDSQQNWDMLELRGLKSNSAMYRRTCTALQMAEMTFREFDETPCMAIELSSVQFDGELPVPPVETSGTGHCQYVRHRPRGSMYDDADPRWDLFEQCLALSGGDARSDTAARQFFRDVHAAATRSGAADLSVCREGNQVAACCYNVHLDGTLVTLFTGGLLDATAESGRHLLSRTEHRPLRSLVSWMLRDSAERQDVRWVSTVGMDCRDWPTTLLDRSRIVHYRRGHRGRRFMGRLAQWLPLPS